MTEAPLLTAQELAEHLRLSRASIYRLSETNKIPSIHLGPRIIRFILSDVMEALTNNGGDSKCQK